MDRRTLVFCIVALAGVCGCHGQEPSGKDAEPQLDVGFMCGNGQIDPGGECDHAERNSAEPNAVCRPSCLLARCGDAVIDDACGEQCDLALGNSDSPDESCRTDCRLRRCGDAVVDPLAHEVCDDGNTLPGDGCSADCLSDETCGNAIVDGDVGETCEDGNTDDLDGCLDCVATEIRVNTYTQGDQRLLSAVMLGDGGSFIAWTSIEQRDGTWATRILGQRFAPDGSRDGTEIQLGPTLDIYLSDIDVASSGAGELIVTWSEGQSLVGLRVDASGNPLGELVSIAPTLSVWRSHAKVAMVADGSFVVVYRDYVPPDDDDGVIFQVFDPFDVPVNDATIVATSDSLRDYDVAWANSDQFVVVWAQPGVDGDGYGVVARRYSMDGVALEPQFLVNTTEDDDQAYPRVAAAGDGRFTVVWLHQGDGPQQNDIYGRSYDIDGVPLGAEFRVNEFTWYNQSGPAIAMADDGRFVIAWMSFAQGSDDWDIYARVFDELSAPLGGEMAVNYFHEDRRYGPEVAINGSGELVVAWTNFSDEGDQDDLYIRRYGVDGTPLGIGP